MTTKVLIESAQTATKTSTGRFRAILAVPGKGSSGTYSAEMLKRYGPVAFPPGMKAYINHDEKRDARDLLGHYPEGAVWDENEGAEGALVSELEPLPSKVDFVEEVAPHVALSLFALGKADTAGNITELIYHRTNGVDMVGYGGLEGSKLGEKISEAALSLLQERAAASADHEREEESMTPEEMKALLAEVLAPVFTFVSEQKQAAEAARLAAEEADKGDKAPTVKEAVAAYATESEKVKAEKLFPTQEAAILAELAEGKDISKLLEDAKKIRDEATTTITESFSSTGGRRVDTGSDSEAYGLGMAW